MALQTIEIVKAVATPGTAVALAPANTNVVYVLLQAKAVTGDNTGNVFIGKSGVDKTTRQIVKLAAGDVWEPEIPRGEYLDLSELYIDAATAADGVTGIAFQRAGGE